MKRKMRISPLFFGRVHYQMMERRPKRPGGDIETLRDQLERTKSESRRQKLLARINGKEEK